MAAIGNSCYWLADFFKSSPLKPLGQMNRNLVGSIYGRSSIKIAFRFIWPSGFRGDDYLRNQPIRNKNCLWRPCLFTNRVKMRNQYRGPSIDASYQVSVHLEKRFHKWYGILVDVSFWYCVWIRPFYKEKYHVIYLIYVRSSIKSVHFVPVR
jgi:hypothetical protein